MKKFFFILENYGIGGGGSERVIVNLCNELSKTNPNIYIVSLTNKGNFYKNKINKRVNTITLPYKKSFFSIYNLYYLLKDKNPHIVLCTSFHTTLFLIFIKVLITKKFFLISRVTNNINQYFKNYKSFKLQLVYFLYFNLLKYVDKFVCISTGLMQELKKKTRKKYHRKIMAINNPIDEKYIIKFSKAKILNKNYLKKNFILTIGRLNVNKDHITLIKAFKYFLYLNKKKYFNYYLVIIGTGNLFSKLMKFIKKENLQNKIKILKNIDNPYIFIKKSKLFVLSSIFEGNPNVLLEAQLLKKKIVSTDCNYGPSEILKKGKYGYLVKEKDYKDLGFNMYLALKKKNKSISLSELRKRNSLKVITSKYKKLFESLNAK